MPDDPPVAPPAPIINPIFSALGLEPVNPAAVASLGTKYGEELKQTQGALSKVNATRESITSQNLRLIDEAISGLKNSRYEGMVGFDPAVSAALAAGFLKTTPGVAGNFMSELGNAMGNAAPVIANKQKGDRDSFALLAELQRKRGEFEAEPTKEQQTELRAREKEIMGNIREVEKAGLRAPAGAATASANRDKLIEQMHKDAEAEIKGKTDNKMRKTGDPLVESEAELIRAYVINKKYTEFNARHPGEPPLPLPFDPGIAKQGEDLLKDTTDMLKGKDLVYYRYRQGVAPGQTPMSQETFEASARGQAANAEAVAKKDAALETSLPENIAKSEVVMKHIDDIINHSALRRVVSPNLGGVGVTSSEGKDFMSYYKQLELESFMEGVKAMQGTGPLSNAEGEKIKGMIGRIGLNQNPDNFVRALREIQGSLSKMIADGRQKMDEFKRRREASGAPSPVSSGSGTPDLTRFAPGDVDKLKASPTPQMRKFFDTTYGPGSADTVLGGR